MILRTALALALCAAPAMAQGGYDDLLREHLFEQVRLLPAGERPRVGLVLSAGAVRGVAHVGVIQVLENAGFPVDVVAGTSMGAVVGSLYASGMDMDVLRTFPRHLTLNSGSNLSNIRLISLILNDSLLSTEALEKELARWIGQKRFDQTDKAFACVAMDIRTGEKIIFRDGPLAPAVRASMNLPGLFKPVEYRHRYLVDGGVVDYIPVDAAHLLGADWTIASVTEGDYTQSVPTNVLQTLEQIFDIRGALLAVQQKKEADIVIEPAVGTVNYYDVDKAAWVMEKGMAAAAAGMDQAKESLVMKTLPSLLQRWRPQ